MRKGIIYLIILALLSFASGIALGIVWEKHYTNTHLPKILREHFRKHPQRLKPTRGKKQPQEMLLKRLEARLNLTASQKEEIKRILKESKEKLKEKAKEFRKELASLREESRTKISEILNPEQKEIFEKMLKERKSLFRKRPFINRER